MKPLKNGQRVKFIDPYDVYPHFVVERGATGTVTYANDEMVSVKMDAPISGAEEWNNEVMFYSEDAAFVDGDTAADVAEAFITQITQ